MMVPTNGFTQPLSVSAQWIWVREEAGYGLLRKVLPRCAGAQSIQVRCAAFDHYEIYLDGCLALEGPLPGDFPAWVPEDEAELPVPAGEGPIVVDVLVHHSGLDFVHFRGKSRPGFRAVLTLGESTIVTDSSWQAAALTEWSLHTPRMNHLLEPLEDVDLRAAKWHWSAAGARLHIEGDFPWHSAQVLAGRDDSMARLWTRKRDFVSREICQAQAFRPGKLRAEGVFPGLPDNGETVQVVLADLFTAAPLDGYRVDLNREDAFVVDFGDMITGMPCLEIDTPAALEISLGWSERLGADGLPVVYSKGTHYCARFRICAGRHVLKTFHWTGFRYLRILLRGEGDAVGPITLGVSGVRRYLQLPHRPGRLQAGTDLARIEALCLRTLERTLPDYPSDCPTREKAHYWADGLFIGLALEKVYQHRGFIEWYFEAFRRVPVTESGLFGSVYPGRHRVLADACFFPVIGWRYARQLDDKFQVDERLWEKAMHVYEWSLHHLNAEGLLTPSGWGVEAEELIFLDHPGLPWHHFSGASLDRRNPSAALNLFYLHFLQSLALGGEEGRALPAGLGEQLSSLPEKILATFWDGRVLRDSDFRSHPDAGVSWLANSLGVLSGVLRGPDAGHAMRAMVNADASICRCTPGTLFWFLQALSVCGLHAQAEAALCELFSNMLASGAVSTWETFEGNDDDSLCHPWLAGPVAMYLADPQGFGCPPQTDSCVSASAFHTGQI